MFIRLSRSYKGSPLMVNSDDVVTIEPILNPHKTVDYDPHTFVVLRGSDMSIEVRETFETLASLLNAVSPTQSVGTLKAPARYSVLVNCRYTDDVDDTHKQRTLDAEYITEMATTFDVAGGCYFRYHGKAMHATCSVRELVEKVKCAGGEVRNIQNAVKG